MIILPFSKDKADILSFIGRDTLFVNEDASVETIFVATKDNGSVRFFINASFLLALDCLETKLCYG